jgi:hypothetical protein
MKRLTRVLRRDRGQMVLIFALVIVPITALVGVVAVDAAVWQSERRGAQKDADLSALAGAYELLNHDVSPVPRADNAKAAANQYGDFNDEEGNARITAANNMVGDACGKEGGEPDHITINVDKKSRTFFAELFGVDIAPDIGAHACAMAGSIITTTGLRPYGIESEPICDGVSIQPQGGEERYVSREFLAKPTATPTPTGGGPTPTATPPGGGCAPAADEDCFELQGGIRVPRFGEWCQLDDGSADPSTSTRGLLDLSLTGSVCSDGGNDNIDENVQNGSGATCSIGDTVIRTTGARPGLDINKGMQVLLAGDGTPPVADGEQCDKAAWGNNNGIDDFDEVLERIDGGTTPSPDAVYQLRACTSPRVIHLIVIGNFAEDPTIKAFAAFYVLGCKLPADDPQDVLPNKCATGAPGQLQLWGIFFNKLELEGDVGAYNPFGTHKIALTE